MYSYQAIKLPKSGGPSLAVLEARLKKKEVVRGVERVFKPNPGQHLNPFEVRLFHQAGWKCVLGITDFNAKQKRRSPGQVHAYIRCSPSHLAEATILVKEALAQHEAEDKETENEEWKPFIDPESHYIWWSCGDKVCWDLRGAWDEYYCPVAGRVWLYQEATGEALWEKQHQE